jgi:DNA polymerase-3 subunit gamma/tau
VPFARDLHPEFGYVGSAPRVFRWLRLVLSFLVLGIVGGESGVAIFMASPDSDPATSANPLDAMALAPAEALIEPKLALAPLPPAPRPANASAADKTDVGSTKPTCREGPSEPEGDCTRVRVVRPLRALNERPLIAAAPIGHRNDPTVLPAPPSAPVEASPSPAAPAEKPSATPAPTEMAIGEAMPADTAPAAEPTPSAPAPRVTANKSRPRVHHVRNESRSSRRNSYSYTRSYSTPSHSTPSYSYQGGYARLW